jgi:hypothetical protein
MADHIESDRSDRAGVVLPLSIAPGEITPADGQRARAPVLTETDIRSLARAIKAGMTPDPPSGGDVAFGLAKVVLAIAFLVVAYVGHKRAEHEHGNTVSALPKLQQHTPLGVLVVIIVTATTGVTLVATPAAVVAVLSAAALPVGLAPAVAVPDRVGLDVDHLFRRSGVITFYYQFADPGAALDSVVLDHDGQARAGVDRSRERVVQ